MKSRPLAAITVMLALAVPMLAACSQATLTLHDVVNAHYDGPDVTTEAEEITDATCIGPLDCVEAYSTAEANYLRFKTGKAAAEYGSSVADGFVVNYFVMDFAGKTASAETQLWAMQALAGTWNDYEGDFPDRGQRAE